QSRCPLDVVCLSGRSFHTAVCLDWFGCGHDRVGAHLGASALRGDMCWLVAARCAPSGTLGTRADAAGSPSTVSPPGGASRRSVPLGCVPAWTRTSPALALKGGAPAGADRTAQVAQTRHQTCCAWMPDEPDDLVQRGVDSPIHPRHRERMRVQGGP